MRPRSAEALEAKVDEELRRWYVRSRRKGYSGYSWSERVGTLGTLLTLDAARHDCVCFRLVMVTLVIVTHCVYSAEQARASAAAVA
jgi:hypothetical protein